MLPPLPQLECGVLFEGPWGLEVCSLSSWHQAVITKYSIAIINNSKFWLAMIIVAKYKSGLNQFLVKARDPWAWKTLALRGKLIWLHDSWSIGNGHCNIPNFEK